MRRLSTAVFLVVVLVCTGAPRAGAVITNSTAAGFQGRNTGEPPVGSSARDGWFLQGQWGSYLGTPIGPNHFITAAHFGGSPGNFFSFGGVNYTIDQSYGNSGQVTVPGSDLRIWKVNETLPAYAQLFTDTDETGKTATIFGRGAQRGAQVQAVGHPTPAGWRWGLHDNGVPAGQPGGVSVASWGENQVQGTVVDGAVGELLQFVFNAPGSSQALPHEAHLSDGDSGGAAFVLDDGVWELAAIHYGSARGPFSRTSDGSDVFDGTIYDARRLFIQNTNGTWVPVTPLAPSPAFLSSFYSSRISSRAEYIYSVTQNISIQQQDWVVPGHFIVGDVNVANTLTVGDSTQPSKATSLLANQVKAANLTLRASARLDIRPNGGAAGVSRVSNLAMSASSAIDVADNSLVVDNGNLSEITNRVRSGRNGGAWNGTGITSSTAATNLNYGLAVIRNSDNGSTPLMTEFEGQTSLGPNAVLVAYTLNGDGDLDFRITGDDYKRLDRGFYGQNGNPAKYLTYRWGDFNLDNVIDSLDYDLIDAAFRAQSPGAGIPFSAARPVPEAGMLSLVAGAALLCLRRRSR